VAGGRGRSTLYAVYDFFERRAGCRYFWDGDIIPSAETVDITGLNVENSPRFEYRGIRYFAHRSLHRFQAEHWSFEDWKKEIDWVIKKRLNLFMLRIGMDDLFQKAFPDIVDYPSADEKLPEAGPGYNDRTLFWPLEYRGELRKKILDYAFERDLMHPEDCGTMTHWYSRTPIKFLEKVKPKLLQQETKSYSEQTGLVWDIREEENLINYFKLTEAHIKSYGKAELFHTIGLAERVYSKDREENLRLKLYTYRRISNYLKEKYSNAPLLIASWDLWMYYTPDEVKRLVEELDPNQAIVFDYTSDTVNENNFTNWGVVGRFPWIFGIFHGYERDSDIRGNYGLIEERLGIAKDDNYCKGMVFWPELSHSDTFMLEYFADNAWAPLTKSIDEQMEKYCFDRYRASGDKMLKVWKAFMPIIQLDAWSKDKAVAADLETFYFVFEKMKFRETAPGAFKEIIKKAEMNKENAVTVFENLSKIDLKDDEFIIRDAYDIARTVCGRYINFSLTQMKKSVCDWQQGDNIEEYINNIGMSCVRLMELLAELLGGHKDYSLYESLERLKSVHKVNPIFETALKNNASCTYCRSYIYENARYLYLPEIKLMVEFIKQNIRENNRKQLLHRDEYMQKAVKNTEIYMNTPLREMVPKEKRKFIDIINDMANEIRNLEFN